MRVLVAGARVEELDARRALAAFVEGWSEGNPDAELAPVVCSAGELDLLDAIESAHGGTREVVTVRDATLHHELPVVLLLVAGTAFVQVGDVLPGAAASDLALASTGSSFGVGQAASAALAAGARRIVLGAGPSGTLDLGVGLIRALADEEAEPLDLATAQSDLPRLLTRARTRLGATELVLAASTTTAVRGMRGAAAALQHVVGREAAQRLDAAVAPVADVLARAAHDGRRADLLAGPAPSPARVATDSGAGVGGGLGAAVAALGGRVVPGAAFVGAEIDLPGRCREIDLAVAVAERVDMIEADGGVLGAVAEAAGRYGVAVLGLGRYGRLETRAAARYGVSATANLLPGRDGLHASARRLAAGWRW